MSILVQRASDVRVEEIDLSQIITSASSSVAAIVVVSKQGSATPKHFTNGDDFLVEYGNPDPKVSYTHYCAIDFFKNGNDLWAVRALGEDYKTSAVLLYLDGEQVKLKTVSGIADPDNIDWNTFGDAIKPMAVFYPNKGPGSYGDRYAIGIESANMSAFENGEIQVATSSTEGNLPAANYSYMVSKIGEGNVESLASNTVDVVIAAGSDQNAVTLSWEADPLAIGYRVYGRMADGFGLIEELGASSTSFTDTGDLIPDESVSPVLSYSDLQGGATAPFTVNIYDMDYNTSTPVESFQCTLGDATDDSGYASELTERINPYSQYVQVASNMLAFDEDEYPVMPNIDATRMGGGDSGTAPTSFDIAQAWNNFSNRQLYSINMLINGGYSNPTVQRAMIELAENRGDTVALLDVPSANQTWQAAIDYRNLTLNANTSYAALFCPDVYEADNINGRNLYIPFSGWAASLCAYTDSVANPSYSPAGLNRGLISVLNTRYTYDDAQASNMYKAQVNYTRTFTGAGIALWEQLTLQAKQSALSWLCVRRIVNVIKVSLYNYLIYQLQEPNDEATERAIKSCCSDYLKQLQQERAISAYDVRIKTTDTERDAGICRVVVMITPTIPIHEIQLQVVITRQGASFDEVEAQL